MKRILSFLPFLLPLLILAQSPIGSWETYDDETGKKRSIINIYEKGGKLHGNIEQLFREPEEDQDPLCDKCKDHRKDQRVIGMNIISEMEKDDDEWTEGEIMDPENGKTYDCKLWMEDDNTLKVRGYIMFFYRTQTWIRAKG